jgi:hypothetical protein
LNHCTRNLFAVSQRQYQSGPAAYNRTDPPDISFAYSRFEPLCESAMQVLYRQAVKPGRVIPGANCRTSTDNHRIPSIGHQEY